MTVTHCNPTGTGPAAHELWTPGVPGLGGVQVPGTVDGVMVLLHGLITGQVTVPLPLVDSGGLLPAAWGTLTSDLLADNWAVIQPSHPEDGYFTGVPLDGLWDDISNDSTFGARFTNRVLLWSDHIIDYCHAQWPGKKIALFGFSEGGWMALQILANRTSALLGGIAHCPATVWENPNPSFTPPHDFATINTTGMDAGPTILNACSVPTLVSYGTADSAVGWAATTVSAISNGVDVSTFTGSGSLFLTDSTHITAGPRIRVATSGGFAEIKFTGNTSNTLTGCTTLTGSGTLSTGGLAAQSNTDATITNAIAAGMPITRLANSAAGSNNHELSTTTVTALMSYVTGTLDPLR